MKEEQYVRICPKCGSTNVHIDFSNLLVWAFGTTTKYKCGDCSYLGSLFPEVLKIEMQYYKKELKEKIKSGEAGFKEYETIDTSTGFPIGVWEVSSAAIGTLLIITALLLGEDFTPLLTIIGIIWTIFLLYILFRILKYRKLKKKQSNK